MTDLDEMFVNAKKQKYAADLIEHLKASICTVVFEKTDGTERVMKCTLRDDIIVPYEKKTDKNKVVNPNIIAVWDVEVNDWRSFKYDSVKEVHY